MQGFSDSFAEQSFDLMAKEIRANVDDIPSDVLGRMFLPMVSEASQNGRTRKIRLQALDLLKVILTSLTKRDDCAIMAQEHKKGDPMPSDKEMFEATERAKESGDNGLSLLLDAIENRIKEEQKAQADLEGATVDGILSAPVHPDLAGK